MRSYRTGRFCRLGQLRDGGIDRQFGAFAGRTPLELDDAVRQPARPNDHLPRQADQVHIGELAAWPFVAVVIQYIDAGGRQFGIDISRRRVDRGIAAFQIDQPYIERRDAVRPDDPGIVMAGFDDRTDKARHADAVRTALDWHVLAVGTGHDGVHRHRIFGTEIEDLADFDTTRRQALVFRHFNLE